MIWRGIEGIFTSRSGISLVDRGGLFQVNDPFMATLVVVLYRVGSKYRIWQNTYGSSDGSVVIAYQKDV